MAIIKVYGGVPVVVKCPACDIDVTVTEPTFSSNGTIRISEMTCVCLQQIKVIARD